MQRTTDLENVPGMSPGAAEMSPDPAKMSPDGGEMSPGTFENVPRWIDEIHVPTGDVYWTPKLVETRMIEAFRFAEKATGRIGPRGYGSGLPTPVRDAEDWQGAPDKGPLVLMLTPREVSLLEAALGWFARYCNEERGATNCAEGFLLAKTRRIPWSRVVKTKRWSRATADRKRERAFSIIAQGLNRDGIPVE